VAVRESAVKVEQERRFPVHVRKVPRTWWLRSGPYVRFAAREFTSIFAGTASGLLLLFLYALSRGHQEYEGFLRWLELPGVVVLFAVILVALLYHTFTWFQLSTRILLIRLGRRVVHPNLVMAILFAAWITASAIVAYFHIWF